MPYTNKAEALLRSKERAANAGNEADAFLDEYLDLSSGVDVSGTTHYRLFLASAIWLEQSPQFQQLSEADGVKFTRMVTAIASLKSLQASYDRSYNLIIPAGFESIPSRRPFVFGTTQLRVVTTP